MKKTPTVCRCGHSVADHEHRVAGAKLEKDRWPRLGWCQSCKCQSFQPAIVKAANDV